MSIRIMAQIWEHGPDNKSELLVLLALADFCNEAGECWPSIGSLMSKSRLSERGVQQVLGRLRELGWVEIEYRKGQSGSNKYRVKTPHAVPPAGDAPRTRMYETPHADVENPARRAGKPLEPLEPSYNNTRAKAQCEEAVCEPPPPKPVKFRMTDNWHLSEPDHAYACDKGMTHEQISDELDGFVAYWADRTDKGGLKSERGWSQCWRNRVRDVAPKLRRANGQGLSSKQQRGSGIVGAAARNWTEHSPRSDF